MENIYTAAKPFFVFATILGLCPIAFEKNLKIKFKIAVIWSCFVFLILTCSCVKLLLNFEAFEVDSDLLSSAWKIIINLDIWSLFILFIYQLLKRKNILSFLTILNSVDEMVRLK